MILIAIDRVAQGWFAVVLHASWQAAVVAVIATIIACSVRWLSPNARYLIVLVALAKFVAPPLMASPFGAFSQLSLARTSTVDGSDRRRHVSVTSLADRSAPDVHTADAVAPELVPGVSTTGEILLERHSSRAGAKPADVTVSPSQTPDAALSWRGWLLVVYACGVALVAVRIVADAIRLRRVITGSRPPGSHVRNEFLSLAGMMGVRRSVRLLLSRDPVTPLACGVFRPTVIVPAALAHQLPSEERRVIFAHELAHHKRADPAVQLAQVAILVVWWFHPCVWVLNRLANRLREECCDDLVVAGRLATREVYCSALLRAVEWCSVKSQIRQLIAPQMSQLENRIKRMMDHQVRLSTSVSRFELALAASLALLLLPGIGVQAGRALADDSQPVSVKPGIESQRSTAKTTVGGVLAGEIVDNEGKAISGARAWIQHGPKSKVVSASCGDDGRFRFTDIQEGLVTVFGWAAGHSVVGIHCPLQRGQVRTDFRVVLRAPQELVLNVTDAEGNPIRGASPSLLMAESEGKFPIWFPMEILQQAAKSPLKSDADGALRFQALPVAGSWAGHIRHPDYMPHYFEQGQVGQGPIAVQLRPGHLVLVRAKNKATDQPAIGANITIRGSNSPFVGYDIPVDEKGEVTVRCPNGAAVRIHVDHPELMWPRANYTGLFRKDTSITAQLRPRVEVSATAIEEASGQPAPGVRIRLLASRLGGRLATAVTDELGKAVIEVPEGPFRLEALGGVGYRPTDQPQVVCDTRESRSPTLVVKAMPAVTGVVLMPSGQPAANAVVMNRSRFRVDPVVTDSDGRFEYASYWHQRSAGVRATAHHPTQRLSGGNAISLEEFEDGKDLVIQLEPESEIFGQVVGANGEGVQDARVWLQSRWSHSNWIRGESHGSTTTDSRGMYRFPGLSRHVSYRVLKKLSSRPTAVRFVELTTDRVRKNKVARAQDKAHAGPCGAHLVGQVAPEVACQSWIGTLPLQLGSLRGKVVLLFFWGTWSERCIAELQQIQMVHDVFGRKDVVVIGLHDSSTQVDQLRQFATQHKLTFPMGIDDATGKTGQLYDVIHWPTMVLINRSGRVVSRDPSHLLPTLRNLVLYDHEGAQRY